MSLRLSSLILFLLFCQPSVAQLPFTYDRDLDEVAFKVKSIDDFIDRFNASPDVDLQGYLAQYYPKIRLTRREWIRSLINRPLEPLKDDTLIQSFIDQVTDSLSPFTLSFKDKYWYVVVECQVIYNKMEYPLKLTLKIKKSHGGFSWSVVSAQSLFLKSTGQTVVVMDSMLPDSSYKYFLSPASHGIDFVNIDKFFRSGSSVRNYLLSQQNNIETEKLVSLIAKKAVVFKKVDSITYYLLQIKGWIIRIAYIERTGRSSGWLIDSILQVTAREKEDFMYQFLYIPKRK